MRLETVICPLSITSSNNNITYSTRSLTERAKEEKLELKRLVDAQVAEAKRKEAADRIEANLRAAQAKEEEKRDALLKKQAKHGKST